MQYGKISNLSVRDLSFFMTLRFTCKLLVHCMWNVNFYSHSVQWCFSLYLMLQDTFRQNIKLMINVYFICSALNLLYVSVRVKPFVCITLMKVTFESFWLNHLFCFIYYKVIINLKKKMLNQEYRSYNSFEENCTLYVDVLVLMLK